MLCSTGNSTRCPSSLFYTRFIYLQKRGRWFGTDPREGHFSRTCCQACLLFTADVSIQGMRFEFRWKHVEEIYLRACQMSTCLLDGGINNWIAFLARINLATFPAALEGKCGSCDPNLQAYERMPVRNFLAGILYRKIFSSKPVARARLLWDSQLLSIE